VLARRAGEAAALVAEQLALDQVRRHGAAVEREVRAAARARQQCSRLATSSLPVPLSPMISTVTSAGADARDRARKALHLGRLADQRRRGDVLLGRGRDEPRERALELGAVDRLGELVARAAAQRVNARLDRKRFPVMTMKSVCAPSPSSSSAVPSPSGSLRSTRHESG
jgi:hypothetical protein